MALPAAGSMAVITMTDVERLSNTARGQYVLRHMSPPAQVARLGGDVLMAVGSWQRRPAVMLAGAAVIVSGWSFRASGLSVPFLAPRPLDFLCRSEPERAGFAGRAQGRVLLKESRL